MSAIATKFSPVYLLAAIVTAFPAKPCGFVRAQSAVNAPAAAPASAPILVTRFIGTLSTKSAKTGDAVSARTVTDLKLKDLDIPKGSKLVGTVTAVRPKDAGHGTSSLAMKFDHVELKDGAILRVQGLIIAIGPLANTSGIGFDSVLGRGGGGYGSGLNPDAVAGQHQDDIPAGSTLEGVSLGKNFDVRGATELRGVRREIRLDPDVMMKVALYKGTQ